MEFVTELTVYQLKQKSAGEATVCFDAVSKIRLRFVMRQFDSHFLL